MADKHTPRSGEPDDANEIYADILNQAVHSARVSCNHDPGNSFNEIQAEPWGDIPSYLTPSKSLRYSFSFSPFIKHDYTIPYTLKDPVPSDVVSYYNTQQCEIRWAFNIKKLYMCNEWFKVDWDVVNDQLGVDRIKELSDDIGDVGQSAVDASQDALNHVSDEIVDNVVESNATLQDRVEKFDNVYDIGPVDLNNSVQNAGKSLSDALKDAWNESGLAMTEEAAELIGELGNLSGSYPEIKILADTYTLNDRLFVSHLPAETKPVEVYTGEEGTIPVPDFNPNGIPLTVGEKPTDLIPKTILTEECDNDAWGFRNKIEDVFPIYPPEDVFPFFLPEDGEVYDPLGEEEQSDECNGIRIVTRVSAGKEAVCIPARFVIQLIKRKQAGIYGENDMLCDDKNKVVYNNVGAGGNPGTSRYPGADKDNPTLSAIINKNIFGTMYSIPTGDTVEIFDNSFINVSDAYARNPFTSIDLNKFNILEIENRDDDARFVNKQPATSCYYHIYGVVSCGTNTWLDGPYEEWQCLAAGSGDSGWSYDAVECLDGWVCGVERFIEVPSCDCTDDGDCQACEAPAYADPNACDCPPDTCYRHVVMEYNCDTEVFTLTTDETICDSDPDLDAGDWAYIGYDDGICSWVWYASSGDICTIAGDCWCEYGDPFAGGDPPEPSLDECPCNVCYYEVQAEYDCDTDTWGARIVTNTICLPPGGGDIGWFFVGYNGVTNSCVYQCGVENNEICNTALDCSGVPDHVIAFPAGSPPIDCPCSYPSSTSSASETSASSTSSTSDVSSTSSGTDVSSTSSGTYESSQGTETECRMESWVNELFVYFELQGGYRILLFRGKRPFHPNTMPIDDSLDNGRLVFENIVEDQWCDNAANQSDPVTYAWNEDEHTDERYYPGEDPPQAIEYLRAAKWTYKFFDEDNLSGGMSEDSFYPAGHYGKVHAYPTILYPEKLDALKLRETISRNDRDSNGLFDLSKKNYAYIYNNEKPKTPQALKAFLNNSISSIHSEYISTPDKLKPTTLFTPPKVVHNTFTFDICQQEVVVNMPIDAKPFSSYTGGKAVVDLGITPIYTLSLSREPEDLNESDVLKICARSRANTTIHNKYFSPYYVKRLIRYSADYPLGYPSDKANAVRKVSKFLYYKFDFKEEAVNCILADPLYKEKETGCCRDYNNKYIYTNEFRGQNDLSNTLAIVSSSGNEDSSGRYYFTGIIAKKVYLRQIIQTHTRISNDRIRLYKFYDWSSGDDEYRWDKYNCLLPKSKVETFNFVLKLKDDGGDKGHNIWRISELLTDAQMIHRRWLAQFPEDNPLLVQPPDDWVATKDNFIFDYKQKYMQPIFWAADKRGIILMYITFYGDFFAEVVVPKKVIRDKNEKNEDGSTKDGWFETYLESVGLLNCNLDDKFNNLKGVGSNECDAIITNMTSGMLFDISNHVNKWIYDHDKIPYLRSFALALKFCRKPPFYGIGVTNLDFRFPRESIEASQEFQEAQESYDLTSAVFEASGSAAIIEQSAIDQASEDVNTAKEESDAANSAYESALENSDGAVSDHQLAALATDAVDKLNYFNEKNDTLAMLNGGGAYKFRNYESYANGSFRRLKVKKFEKDKLKKWSEDLNKDKDFEKIFGDKGKDKIYDEIEYQTDPNELRQDPFFNSKNPKHGPANAGVWLPAGKYVIKYKEGGIAWYGIVTEFSIHEAYDPCSGIFTNFNQGPLCTNVIRFAPGNRVIYPTAAAVKAANENKCKSFIHLGGPIVLSIWDRLGVDDNVAFPTSVTYILDLIEPSPVIVKQWVNDDFSGVKWNTVTNTIAGNFGENTRLFVESFAVERQNGYRDSRYLDGFAFTHPKFDCINIYGKQAIESIDVDANKEYFGAISIDPKPYVESAYMSTTEFSYNTIVFHDLDDEVLFSWEEFGLTQAQAKDVWDVIRDPDLESYGRRRQTREGPTTIDKAVCLWYTCMRDNSSIMCPNNSAGDSTECDSIHGRAACFPILRTDNVEGENYAYKRGRIVSMENGSIISGVNKRKDIYTDVPLSFFGMIGMKSAFNFDGWLNNNFVYIKYLTIYYDKFLEDDDSKLREDTSAQDILVSILGTNCRVNFIDKVHLNVTSGNSTGNQQNSTDPTDDAPPDFSVDLDNLFESGDEEKEEKEEKGKPRIVLDVRNSEYGYVFLSGENINRLNIVKAVATVMQPDMFEKYKAKGIYSSVVYDGLGRIIIFYEDDRNNISSAVSYDKGNVWYEFDGLLPLVKGEKAKRPHAVIDKNSNKVYLFFVYQDTALCMKNIDTTLFIPADSYKGWDIEEGSNPLPDDLTPTGQKEYTEYGIAMRKSPIVIISGDTSDFETKFDNGQVRIYKGSDESKSKNINFTDSSFSAYRDIEGVIRVWYTNGDFLGIKNSYDDGLTWSDTANDILFYKIKEAEGTTVKVADLIYEYKKNTFTECTSIANFRDCYLCERPFDPNPESSAMDNGSPSGESFEIEVYPTDEWKNEEEWKDETVTSCIGSLGEIQAIYDDQNNKVVIAFTFGKSIFVREVDNSLLKFIEGCEQSIIEEDNNDPLYISTEDQIAGYRKYVLAQLLNLTEDSPNKVVIVDGQAEENIFYEEPPSYIHGTLKSVNKNIQPDGYFSRTGFLKLYYFATEITESNYSVNITSNNGSDGNFKRVLNYSINGNDSLVLWLATLSKPVYNPIIGSG